MGKPNFSDEFKRDAVAQITERGYVPAGHLEEPSDFDMMATWRLPSGL